MVCGAYRAIAVWSSTKREIKRPTAVALLVGIVIYSTVMTLVSPREDYDVFNTQYSILVMQAAAL